MGIATLFVWVWIALLRVGTCRGMSAIPPSRSVDFTAPQPDVPGTSLQFEMGIATLFVWVGIALLRIGMPWHVRVTALTASGFHSAATRRATARSYSLREDFNVAV